ncbi:MAG: hypothetical protein KKH83_08520 [Candidatus Margulisbacteria bacterium]|nr:hypothetical protein [Candidatus Margulisiibacteriota bacterium]
MKGKIFFFGVCLLLGVVLSLPSFAATSLSTDENKTIAASFLKNAMEGMDPGPLVEQYCASDITVEFPDTFKLPSDTDNMLIGAEELLQMISAWQQETNHEVDVVEAVGEGDKVALLIRVNRNFDFNMDNQPDMAYQGHLMAFFFELHNQKITKLTGIFDVLHDVEQEKDKKYQKQ